MKKLFAIVISSMIVFSSCHMFQPASSGSNETYDGNLGEMNGKKKKNKKNESAEEEIDLFGTVDFVKTTKYQSILAKSLKQSKPVFIDFTATWCAPCKLMDKRVFTDKNMVSYLNENFINYKVDADEDFAKELTLRYSVTAIPTLLFVNSNGDILVRKEGAAFQTELRGLGDEAIAAYTAGIDN
ncbi:MAG: thioredoxin domain-containing protein [Bacteroidetes bacterium]|jgi:thiol:disulfide interchange protein|nr:thioredoxin domain-containing protein [Bacteroidota bacterium]